MIEEIKKEILIAKNCQFHMNITNSNEVVKYIKIDTVLEILDKHDNQPDYKSAFEQVKREYEIYDIIKLRIEQIEQKYNLGGK